MAKHQRYDHIRQLLDCLVKVGMGEDDMIDEMIGACILVVADNPNEVRIENMFLIFFLMGRGEDSYVIFT